MGGFIELAFKIVKGCGLGLEVDVIEIGHTRGVGPGLIGAGPGLIGIRPGLGSNELKICAEGA